MRIYLLSILLLISGFSFGQKMSISGTVQDTVAKVPLQYAVAMAVRIKDSVLVAHTRTNAEGRFELKNLDIDTVQVIVSNPRFGEQSYYVFGSATNREFDFGKIILPPKSQQLNEVIIYAFKDPVYYKGDTLMYTADSFKVKPNATVEDLLKKLPGIKVDASGKISSQGKEVSQVLVDGDEFFGSDPTVATRNLAANGVESVQVYEKKNENTSEGGEETIQVMNLKLKEDAKKGYFGKVSGASDFQRFYEGELLANKFKGSQKVSIFALGSNTPKSGFAFGDMYKYGLNNEMNFESDDEGNQWWYNNNNNQPQGIPQTFKSGIYYNDKFGKTKLNFNYSYNQSLLDASGSTHSEYFLADTSYITDNISTSRQETGSHNINFKITQALDSLTDLEIEPKLKLNTNNSNSFQQTDFLTSTDSLTRRTDITSSNKAEGYNLNATARLIKRFKNKDRFLNMTYNITLTDDQAEGFLKSENLFFSSTIADSIIDQKKTNTSSSQTHNAAVVYTEPLSKKVKLSFDYNFNYNQGAQSKKAQNFNNGEYSLFDSTLTNDFENYRSTNRLGVKFIYEVKKMSFNFGARVRNVSITNSNLITGQDVKQSVNNILPFMGYMYKFSENTRFHLRYTTNSNQPNLNQLQPVPDNSNPNQVKVGNPDLLPTFVNNVNMSFNSYKPISGRYVWANLNVSSTENAFSNSIRYDSLGRTYSQTVNVDGNYNGNFYIGSGIPVFSKLLNFEPNISGNMNRYSSYINDEKNVTTTSTIGAGLGIRLQTDSVEFGIVASIDYYETNSSLSLASNQPYTLQEYSADLKWQLPWKILVETSANYKINGQRAEGYNLDVLVWDASISKAFLKNENLILTLSGNDLLNQNIQTTRTIQDNVITDSKTNIISRYFLLKLTYKFNSTKTKDNDQDFW
jgi:hypothetical protein